LSSVCQIGDEQKEENRRRPEGAGCDCDLLMTPCIHSGAPCGCEVGAIAANPGSLSSRILRHGDRRLSCAVVVVVEPWAEEPLCSSYKGTAREVRIMRKLAGLLLIAMLQVARWTSTTHVAPPDTTTRIISQSELDADLGGGSCSRTRLQGLIQEH